jgi:phosphomannomutase
MAIVLDLLAKQDQPLSDIVDAMPAYVIRKHKLPMERDSLAAALDRVADAFSAGRVDREDGIRVDFDDAWVQLRASNTEPIVRVIAEAKDEERADVLCERTRRILEQT